jgi:HK97 family phage portal protein
MAGPLQTLANRSPVPHTARGRSFDLASGGVTASKTDQLSQMERVATLFSISDLIATSVAGVDWHLYRQPGRPEAERVEVFDHPALVVWENPATVDGQTIYSQDEFIEAEQQHYELTGEMWTVLETKTMGRLSGVTDMWPVRPDRMAPVKSRESFLSGYVYSIGGEKIPLELNQVIFEKRQNPLDPWRGLSPIASLMMDIEGERAAAAYNFNFFINGAVPGGVLELDRETLLSDQEWEAWTARWRSQHQGVSNAHRIAVMEMGKFSERKMSQRDMEFVDLRNFSREAMMEAWRISKAMLGHVEDVNRANAFAQRAVFAERIMVPRLERWKKLLNTKLLPKFGGLGEGYEFDYDSPVPGDAEEERQSLRARSLSAASFVREGFDPAGVLESFGFPPIPWVGRPDAPEREPEGDDGDSDGGQA